MRRLGIILLSIFVLYVTPSWATYVMPIGILDPGWGIETPVCPTLPSPWNTNTAGFYYVESGGTNANQGYPGSPRGTLPTPASTPAGSVICVNGTYTTAHDATLTYVGTLTNPIFIRSYDPNNKATITKKWGFLLAHYVVMENINSDWRSSGNGKIEIYQTTYLTIRGGSFRGDATATGSILIQPPASSYDTDHIIIYNNTIYDSGDWQTALDQDCHGVSVGSKYIQNVWVLNNIIYRTSGDGIQIGAGSNGALTASQSDKNIYVGKNLFYENRQNGVWVKQASDVIISQNVIRDIRRPIDNLAGGGVMGFQYGPERVWFLFNTGYNCNTGIGFAGKSSGFGTVSYLIGNLIYNIHDTAARRLDWTNPEQIEGALMTQRSGSYIVHLANNTFHDYDTGIQQSTGIMYLYNNIFSTRDVGVSGHDVWITPASTYGTSEFKNNLVENTNIVWNTTTYTTIASLATAISSRGTGNIGEIDPLFVSEVGNNYQLQSTSPAKDQGLLPASMNVDVYTLFKSLYPTAGSIRVDQAGNNRPSGAGWDIGAYEYMNKLNQGFSGKGMSIK
jgi:hypothetical protein